MKIKNFEELARNELRRAALQIAEAGLQAIDTKKIIRELVRVERNMLFIKDERIALDTIGKIVVGGVGKCALQGAEAFEEILNDRIAGGIVLYVAGEPKLTKIEAVRGTHPLPSEGNIHGAASLVGSLKDLKENDLAILIISGGGSALLCLPEEVGCAEEARILTALMRAGATIQEINTIRKHLSLARGGYLTKHTYPARLISLIFSDVPGNNLGFVASGPTVRDTTTMGDAAAILAKYDILRTCGMERCGLLETPKEKKYFENVRNILAASNKDALVTMEAKARALGYHAKICATCLTGEAAMVGRGIVGELRKAKRKSAFLYGGETTVTVKGKGKGGRNLELVLSALRDIVDGELLVSVASDGRDNGEYAGAICDRITQEAVQKAGVNIEKTLANNDEYPVFGKIENFLMTGDTGSNVSDLVIAIKE